MLYFPTNFKFNFTSPAIYLSCHPRAPSVPLRLTLRSGLFGNLRCSPKAWLLPVMAPYNWISWVLDECCKQWHLWVFQRRCLSCSSSSPRSSHFLSSASLLNNTHLWVFIIVAREENVLPWHSNLFRKTFGGFITSSSPRPVYPFNIRFLNSPLHTLGSLMMRPSSC